MEKSAYYYEHFLKLEENCEEIYEKLGNIYINMGRNKEGDIALSKARAIISHKNQPDNKLNDLDIKSCIDMIEEELKSR